MSFPDLERATETASALRETQSKDRRGGGVRREVGDGGGERRRRRKLIKKKKGGREKLSVREGVER